MKTGNDGKTELYGLLKSARHDSLIFNLSADKKDDLDNLRLMIHDSSILTKIYIKTDLENGSVLSLPEIVCEDGKKARVEISTLPKTGMFKKVIELKFSPKSDISEIWIPSLNRHKKHYIKSLLWLPKNTIIRSYDFLYFEDGSHIRNVGELQEFCIEEYRFQKAVEADKKNEIADYSPF